VTSEAALTLLSELLRVTLYITGPILIASLIAGLAVGVMQTATQVNEPSVSYVVKAIAVVGVLVALGGTLLAQATAYTKDNFRAVAGVVKR